MNLQRRKTDDVPSATDAVRFYGLCALGLCAFTIVAVIAARVLVPTDLSLVVTIVGLATPVIGGLVVKMQQAQAAATDGRMQQLIETTGEQKRLEGLVEGLKENPDVNIK